MPAPSVPMPFRYNAWVIEVTDGDTFTVEVDWGRRRYETPVPIRLLGGAAREKDEPGGAEAKANLAKLLPKNTSVVLDTVKDDKYAPRWDASVTYLVDGVPHDLVTDLIASGWMAPWNGRGVQPKPAWPRQTDPKKEV